MTKTNKILALVAALQLGLVFLVHGGDQKPTIANLSPVVADFEANTVTRITITAFADRKADAPNIDLVRQGEEWRLASHFDYPATTSKADGLIAKLKGIQTRRSIARGEARQKQLGVHASDFEHRVVIQIGERSETLYVGRAAGRGKTALRLQGSQEVHAATALPSSNFSTKASGWVDSSYFALSKENITRVSVSNAQGTFEFSKGVDDTSASYTASIDGKPLVIPEDKVLAESAVGLVWSSVADIRMQEPVMLAKAQVTPIATAEITSKAEIATLTEGMPVPEEEVHIVEVFAEGEEHFVRERGNEFVVSVNKNEITALLELNADKLVEEPKPPAPPNQGIPPGMIPGGMPPGMLPH